MRKLLYHWYEEPKYSIVWVNVNKLKKLSKNNLKNLKRLPCVKVLTLYRILQKNNIEKERLEKLNIVGINQSKLFPINIDQPEFYRIVSSVLNEGNLNSNRDFFEYYNQELNLHKILNENILKTFGFELNKPKIKGNRKVFRSYSYGIIPRALKKFGLKTGNKTTINMYLPKPFLNSDSKKIVPYFQQLMLEEMSTTIRFKRRDDRFYIGFQLRYGRSQDITKLLSIKTIQKISPRIRFKTSLLSNKILMRIKQNILPLMKEEQQLLKMFQIKTSIRPSFFYKIRKNSVKIHWVLNIEENMSIEKFYKNFVFNSPKLLKTTRKWVKMIRFYKIWKNYKGRQLTFSEIEIIKEKIKK